MTLLPSRLMQAPLRDSARNSATPCKAHNCLTICCCQTKPANAGDSLPGHAMHTVPAGGCVSSYNEPGVKFRQG